MTLSRGEDFDKTDQLSVLKMGSIEKPVAQTAPKAEHFQLYGGAATDEKARERYHPRVTNFMETAGFGKKDESGASTFKDAHRHRSLIENRKESDKKPVLVQRESQSQQ